MRRFTMFMCAALVAALLLSAGCGNSDLVRQSQEVLDTFSGSDGQVGRNRQNTENASIDDDDISSEPYGQKDADVLDDGTLYLAEIGGRTHEEKQEFEDIALPIAEDCCDIIFNYNQGDNIEDSLSPLMAESFSELSSMDTFDTIYSGINMVSSLYWFEPFALYAVGEDDDLILNLYGTARAHMSSSRFEENDYDVFIAMAFICADGTWKINRISSLRLHELGSTSIEWSEISPGGVRVTANKIHTIDVQHPDSYLSEYKTNIREDFENYYGWTGSLEDDAQAIGE